MICVSPNQEIHLFNHRLYMHEFLTHPPLKELRVIFKEDEGPLNDSNDIKVVFVVSWSTHPDSKVSCWNGLAFTDKQPYGRDSGKLLDRAVQIVGGSLNGSQIIADAWAL